MRRLYAAFAMVAAVVCAGLLPGASEAADAPVADRAQVIFGATGVKAGLIVHLDATDGRLTSELSAGGRFLVHCLAVTEASARQAREHIDARKLNGVVSVERGDLARLPYVDGLVNLVVVEDFADARKKGLTRDEVMRVLCPGGVAWLGAPGAPATVTRKERPATMDDWTHWLHGPDGTNLSSDALTGPAARVQWLNGPIWYEGTNLSELFANGRSFNLVEHKYWRPQWARITARDAYNGLILWRREIKLAGKRYPRRTVVAVGDRVTAVVEIGGPLVALDAATGEVVKTYDVDLSPVCVFHREGKLILMGSKAICAVDVESGEVQWRRPAPATGAFMLEPTNALRYSVHNKPYVVAGGGRLFLFVKDADKPPYTLACYDLNTGAPRWQRKQPGEVLACYKGAVLLYDLQTQPTRTALGKGVHHALSAEDGHTLWTRPHVRRSNHPDEPSYARGIVWISDNSGKGRQITGVDVVTGEEKQKMKRSTWGHCARLITTERYMIGKMTEVVSFDTGKRFGLGFYKNGCGVGQVPANGMLYTFPISCSCIAYVRGYVAFAPAVMKPPETLTPAADRVAKGPAYGFKATAAAAATDWPVYRHDNARSGATAQVLPAPTALKVLWRTSVNPLPKTLYGKAVTPPVIAAGMVFVAAPDANGVVALDAASGKVRWRVLLGGRVEGPPTFHRGLCLVGTNTGWVYCLRASDGVEVWRFRAAPDAQRIAAYGRLESPWPVPGVMVQDGVAYFAAGRHAKTLNGIHVYAADPFTGKILWETRVDNKRPETWYDNHVNDVLVGDGKHVFMAQLMFEMATGAKSRTWAKKKVWPHGKQYRFDYLLSGHGRDTSAVFPFGFLYDRGDDPAMERYDSTFWYYRGIRGLTLALTEDTVFGVTAMRRSGRQWTLFAMRDDAVEKSPKPATVWSTQVPAWSVWALLPAGPTLFVAGTGKDGGVLSAYAAADGRKLGELAFDEIPVFDGLAAAGGRLTLSTRSGKVLCFGTR